MADPLQLRLPRCATGGQWHHDYWPDWATNFGPGLKRFAEQLSAVALSRAEISSTDKPFRRADGSAVRLCKMPAGEERPKSRSLPASYSRKARTIFATESDLDCAG